MKDSLQSAEGTSARGLYREEFEHDACGVGFVASIRGEASHEILTDALHALERLEHRGGGGSDAGAGDGAGILLQLPHAFFMSASETLGFSLPARGRYAVGMMFLPRDPGARARSEDLVERVAHEEGLAVLGWRDVPVDPSACGESAQATLPCIRQVFVGADEGLETKAYVARKRIDHMSETTGLYVCTMSSQTICYKGLLLPGRLAAFYADLREPAVATAIAVVHQRFSTNTFPTWHRAHPYRYVAHNGEINTLRGNANAMRAREAQLASQRFGSNIDRLCPVVDASGSDSAMFDNVLELLVQSGRSLPHAMLMMLPEAWEKHLQMPESHRAFYEYHASLMEPWDGPAAMAFTDGTVVGAVLDRNGLRPMRYTITTDGVVVAASEAGVLDVAPERVLCKERLAPGRMLVVDTAAGRIVGDDELKGALASAPYQAWIDANLVHASALPEVPVTGAAPNGRALHEAQFVFGYTREDARLILAPMATNGEEAVGSMGNDAPPAMLSEQPQLVFNYFRQLFAQVTNPPIDPIREELVMSLRSTLGRERNLLDETLSPGPQLVLEHPVLSSAEFAKITHANLDGLRTHTLSLTFPAAEGVAGLEDALAQLCRDAESAVREGASLLVLSDRAHTDALAPVPSLLAAAAVHHHLIRSGVRTKASLVIDSGEPREVMHFCLLVGYGAAAVHPYLAIETVAALANDETIGNTEASTAVERYLHAANKGILKAMSKVGISTLQSYRGAQIFEALGLHSDVIERYFPGTPSRLQGVGLREITEHAIERHASRNGTLLPIGGQYQWRRGGEQHAYVPDTIASLQHAVRSGSYTLFKRYTAAANDENHAGSTLRGLLQFVPGAPVPLEEVEPASEIVTRFKTGAMSFGSISREAHENLAIAMNRIGARSNSGEGGEEPARFVPDANGDSRRSAIKQVASGRFGVTSHYLVNADELQIKMAQGAKPGEGGQLPGHKVDAVIAGVRHATEGVGLISPPPHHDIYSIEDLAQLIFDLKSANDRARISVKLVAEVGVGTVAAGVAKAKADVILISGDSGGTGAAPLTSIKHAGIPWELGLAEAQQVLVMNGLRGRVRLETDGQLKTGRDVAIACLLGAEEFGFATAALVASGCILMRVCHLNTCPVGIATQDPELRKRFPGQPEHVINFMFFIAQELREIMADLGFRTLDQMVGRVDRLRMSEASSAQWKRNGLDLSAILAPPVGPSGAAIRCVERQEHTVAKGIDTQLIALAHRALASAEPVSIALPICNIERATATRLSAEISRRHGADGLPPQTISVRFYGTAGQSFGAFLAPGIDITLEGEANDYLAKGMSGGRIAIVPPKGSRFAPEEQVIVGNVALYGATRGELFVRGRAGERFAVRNSGALAVVEGVGDHGCEYMTRGTVVVLGTTGRIFAAGMSGGVAYVYDADGRFEQRCNGAMVDLERLGDDDAATVRSLIHRHYERTASAVAWRSLSGWREWSRRLVKVMPREYRKALAARRRSAAVNGSMTRP